MSWNFFQEFWTVAKKFRKVILRCFCLPFWLIRFMKSMTDFSITLIRTTFLALHENLRSKSNWSSLEKHAAHEVPPLGL